jgi:hypothetical protein
MVASFTVSPSTVTGTIALSCAKGGLRRGRKRRGEETGDKKQRA